MADPASVLTSTRLELARLPRVLDCLLDLDEAGWRSRPAPAEWAPIEIVCHLRDEEVEDFAARVRVVLEGGSQFTPIDPERWVEERRYRNADPREVITTLRERRAANLTFLASVSPDRLLAAVAHRRLGRLSGLDLLVAWVTHDQLHLAQLSATLARLWATRWAPLRADYAGPSGCSRRRGGRCRGTGGRRRGRAAG
jgi:hypothetical protein